MLLMPIGKRLVSLEMNPAGKVIQQLRKQSRKTQEDFARDAGMTANALSKLERGLHAPSRLSLKGIAEALKMSEEDLERLLTGEVMILELPRELYDSIAERAAHEGHGSVVAFLARVATPKTKRITKRLEGAGGAAKGSHAHPPAK